MLGHSAVTPDAAGLARIIAARVRHVSEWASYQSQVYGTTSDNAAQRGTITIWVHTHFRLLFALSSQQSPYLPIYEQ